MRVVGVLGWVVCGAGVRVGVGVGVVVPDIAVRFLAMSTALAQIRWARCRPHICPPSLHQHSSSGGGSGCDSCQGRCGCRHCCRVLRVGW